MSFDARQADELGAILDRRDFASVRPLFTSLSPADAADLLRHIDDVRRAVAFRLLPKAAATDAFRCLEAHEQEALIRALGEKDAAEVLNAMSDDDRTALLEECPEQAVRLLSLLEPAQQRVALQLLGYPKDSVGRMMTTRFVAVSPDWTVRQVLEHVRERARDVYYVHVVLAVDTDGRLLALHRIRDIFLADPGVRIDALSASSPIHLLVTGTRAEALAMFRRHSRTVIPVVDSSRRVLGIVTIDDILETATEEAARDIALLGGSEVPDEPLLRTPLGHLIGRRAGWLVLLFVGEMFTATAMGFFEDEIQRAVVLSLFLPLIISSGGNSGSQSSALVIRAMALGEVGLRDWARVFRREIASGLGLGAILGTIGFARIAVWHHFLPHMCGNVDGYGEHWLLLATVIALSLLGVVLWGSLSGAMLPFLLRWLGFDPAKAAAPFVATIVDVTGLVIYFVVAALMLRGTLL